MFYEKFISLCSKKGVSPTSVVKSLGLSAGNLPNWRKGAIPRNTQIKSIADYFGVTVEDLLDKTSTANPSGLFAVEYKKIPLLGDIACGIPIIANQQEGVYVQANTDMKVDYCLTARGDSMTGARIYDGDIVFCKACPTVENGEIAVVVIGDEVTLKRFYYDREHQTVSLFPENPSYKTLRYVGSEISNVRVIGKAVSFQGTVR